MRSQAFSSNQTKDISATFAIPHQKQSTQQHFSSQIAFILAASGSAIGLANLWKFPYIAFALGGLNLILPYLACLIFVSIPLFIAETVIGSVTQKGPSEAFYQLSQRSRVWQCVGAGTVATGFLISSFYSVVAGWILQYGFSSLAPSASLISYAESTKLWNENVGSLLWNATGHTVVAAICLMTLTRSLKSGLERINTICMPLFFICIAGLFYWATTLSGFSRAIEYISTFHPSNEQASVVLLAALGHAFFTLSIGQGTLVTYGSYTTSKKRLFSSAVIIATIDTAISLLATIILISTVFSAPEGTESMSSGPSLLFEAMPAFFGQVQGGAFLAPLFFFLVFLAAITSQISALEPSIKLLEERWNFSRKNAGIAVITASWVLGLISAASLSNIGLFSYNGTSWFDAINYITTSWMLPIGAIGAAWIATRTWGTRKLLQSEFSPFSTLPKAVQYYILYSLRCAPFFILLVFLHATGIWS